MPVVGVRLLRKIKAYVQQVCFWGYDGVLRVGEGCFRMSQTLLFVVNVDWFFLSHRLPIALAAQRRGYRVHIAAGLTDKKDALSRHGFVLHRLPIDRSGSSLFNNLRTLVELWRIFKAIRPDVVHLVTIKPVLLGGLVAHFARIPAIVVAISGLGFVFVARGLKARMRRQVVSWLYRLALRHKNLKVIFQNQHDLDTLVSVTGMSENKVAIVRGSGVDLDEYCVRSTRQEGRIVLLAARLIADKGVVEFVNAARIYFKQIQVTGSQVRFVLVGQPDLENPACISMAQVKAWVDEGVIEYWGHRMDMPQVISDAYIVALPSYYGEGLPKILIEAAACGRPVVTTDHPGCRDAIEPGVTGVLVPVRDSEALAAAIDGLLQEPEKCLAMGRAGRELAERAFDVNAVATTHMVIYEDLMAKGV